MAHSYKHPPIVEAVIEVRFVAAVPQELIEKAATRLSRDYESSEAEQMTEITIEAPTGKQQVKQEWSGSRLSSADKADILLLRRTAFVCARLAPYCGWDAFRARAEANWASWKRTAGHRDISRLGLRYINRIDVPITDGGFQPQHYLNVYPQVATLRLPVVGEYTMQITSPTAVDEYGLRLSTAIVPSPLIGHHSVALDIDVFRDIKVPSRDEQLWSALDTMRIHKNRFFEASITDQARKIFDR